MPKRVRSDKDAAPRPSRVSEPHTVNIYEAKTRLSELVDRAASGEIIVIAKAGTPVARLVPLPADIQTFFDDPVIFPPDAAGEHG